MTEYLILQSVGTADDWSIAGKLKSASSEQAIRKHVGNGGKTGTFVAVPARNWTPRTVRTETVTRVKFGSPEPEKTKAAKS